MREIRFRGMDIGGKWHYGNLAIINQKIRASVPAGYYISNSVGMPFAYLVRPESVGQFTGLKDKNGKEIFEGDIVQKTEGSWYAIAQIEWRNGGYEAVGKMETGEPIRMYLGDVNSVIEVIGNIYENPDLLP